METNKIDYSFQFDNYFFTLQKKNRIHLQKTSDGIKAIKQELMSNTEDKDYHLDRTKRFSGRITAGGVYNQLANIRQIVFEVTDACNLRCKYCTYGEFYDDYDKRENNYIDIDKAKILIDFVVEKLHTTANTSQQKEVTISFYGGEPLLNMDFIQEIVRYTQSKQDDCVKFRYSMTTNSVLLKKHIDFLVRHDFRLLVSLDGSEANDTHRIFHNQKSSFPVVYENLIYTRAHYPDFFDKNVMFNAVLHNLNNESEVFHYFYQEFGKIPMFSDVNDMGVRQDLKEAFNNMARPKENKPNTVADIEMKQILDLNSGESRSLQHFIFHYSGNVYRNYNELLLKKKEIRYIPTATCYPFSKKIFMTVNNKIFPCERIGHQYSLGKVTEKGVEIDCEEVARKYNGYYDSLRKQCATCYQGGHCVQCIYIIKDLENKPTCQGFLNKQNFERYLQEKIAQLSQHPELYKRIMEEVNVIE